MISWYILNFSLDQSNALLIVPWLVSRGLVMMTFSPILMRIGYGLSWQNAVVAAWGGLRGAVGLALALQVYIDHPLVGGKVRHGTNFNTPAGLEKSPHTSVFT